MQDYRNIAPSHQIYRFCPLCAADLRDKCDEINGYIHPVCTGCGWTYYPPNSYGSLAVVEADGGIVLICPPEARAAAPAALPGGIAEYGEEPADCAIREVEEETGLVVEIVAPLGEPFMTFGPFGPMLMFGYLAKATGGQLTDGDEGPAGIYPLDAIPVITPDRKASRRILDCYLASAQRSG